MHATDEPPTTEGTSTTTDPAIATSISPTTTATNVAATSTATVLATTTPTTPMTTDDGQSTAGDSTAAGKQVLIAFHLVVPLN